MNFFVTARSFMLQQDGRKVESATKRHKMNVDVNADAVADGVAGAGPAAISFITYLLKHKEKKR